MVRKLAAELVGAFWLVFGGCGAAVLAANFAANLGPPAPGGSWANVGIGFVGVALAFGLTLLTMAYAIGPISGCHINPAVTIGLCTAGRFPARDVGPYIGAQLVGGIAGAAVLLAIASGDPNFALGPRGFACNGYGDHSPGHYSLPSCLAAEVVLTFMFLIIILGATDKRAPAGFAPLAIGLGLTLIHLIGIPVTNLSVNPARSTGPALILAFADTWALAQLWLFWVAPIAGAVLAGLVYRTVWPAAEEAAREVRVRVQAEEVSRR